VGIKERLLEFAPVDFGKSPLDRIIGQSRVMLKLKRDIERAARCDCAILIRGETGTGKTLIARALHELSLRPSRPFVHVNCGAIPEGLIESELFGHLKGAFTGAHADKKGFFEAARDGTIFLDEIAEMRPCVQVKVLHTLQEKKFTPLGATVDRTADVRVITATHQDIEAAIADRHLREDFYYRINEVTLTIPPLRERSEDIHILAQYFIGTVWQRVGLKQPARITCEAMDQLSRHHWPGNIRQLEKMITSLSFRSEQGIITARQVEIEIERSGTTNPKKTNNVVDRTLSELIKTQEKQRLSLIHHAIDLEGGNVAAAAARLGTKRTTLYKMKARLAKR
jgi:transcriptional regulator with PAS, ATPase and Fis domain